MHSAARRALRRPLARHRPPLRTKSSSAFDARDASAVPQSRSPAVPQSRSPAVPQSRSPD
ncbi:hypothetical protein D2W70_25120 [Burkholderia pseudomallei]|nr:hypothetical protein BOC46_09555 [Burkholderia pseudomallei]ARL30159.1 hypothetical protein BOC48_12730 [Burkholderia pseudomallei]AUL57542.1 hypothetical protein BHT10_17945 [Burkholderia pseudomallei]RIV47021.1 hypothetical protein D2W70_25120 [Burkholderia pseudomallei]RIV57738.1 hypothetical protein D2W49_26260 [Burkholderia pseudomallei]